MPRNFKLCASSLGAAMSDMGLGPASAGWMMSPGCMCWRLRLAAFASFLGMWVAMMIAMMLPSLVPMLLRYRATAARFTGARLGLLTGFVGAGYFSVWTVFGFVVFPIDILAARAEMTVPLFARFLPIAAGAALLLAGVFQLTARKAQLLACCRVAPMQIRIPATAAKACYDGVWLGLRCSACCANLMAILLVIGMMNLGAVSVVTVAITLERLAPAGARIAQVTGLVVIGAGLWMITCATGFR